MITVAEYNSLSKHLPGLIDDEGVDFGASCIYAKKSFHRNPP
jgi:hypothetical protein